ncbi:hypothetical protein HJG60_010808 [Phyllostomus discolor]|uniref:Uncharacterized protein n=1 Tax=Phyllostomus discolor TaxID=89673 RepID=A0A834AHA9_9CHIR|nr:hypothetical protein HJG60_010808 [Phyllostomus discolor]
MEQSFKYFSSSSWHYIQLCQQMEPVRHYRRREFLPLVVLFSHQAPSACFSSAHSGSTGGFPGARLLQCVCRQGICSLQELANPRRGSPCLDLQGPKISKHHNIKHMIDNTNSEHRGAACLCSTVSGLQLEVLNAEVDRPARGWNQAKADFRYAWCLAWENVKAGTADGSASVASRFGLRGARLLPRWLKAASANSREQGRS